MTAKLLAIKDWWKHQHYHKGRGAPWIKLYGALLTDPVFIQFPEAAQAQLMKLWMLASQMGHPLPNNPKLLAGQIGTTGKFHLASIIAAGFIVPCETSDEVLLASGEQSASKGDSKDPPESLQDDSDLTRTDARSRERGELELEELHRLLAEGAEFTVARQLADALETDADRDALVRVLSRANSKTALAQALWSMLTGQDPDTPQPTARQMGLALRDLAANGQLPTARLIRGYLRDAKAEPDRAAPRTTFTNGKHANAGEASYAAGRAALEDVA